MIILETSSIPIDLLEFFEPIKMGKTTTFEITTKGFGSCVCENCGYFGKPMLLEGKENGFFNPNGEEEPDKRICPNCRKDLNTSHFAVFPEELIETPIKAGCPKGGTVLDPFCGSGTSMLVAEKLGMNSIGIEINPVYVEMIKGRMKPFLNQMRLDGSKSTLEVVKEEKKGDKPPLLQ